MLEVVAQLVHFDGHVRVAERELLHRQHRDHVLPLALIHRDAAVACAHRTTTATAYSHSRSYSYSSQVCISTQVSPQPTGRQEQLTTMHTAAEQLQEQLAVQSALDVDAEDLLDARHDVLRGAILQTQRACTCAHFKLIQ